MITDPKERLDAITTGEDIIVAVNHADLRRLRLFMDRYDATLMREPGWKPSQILDVDNPLDVAAAISSAMADGLARDENDHGLEAFPWGDVVSIELADEMRRRGEA